MLSSTQQKIKEINEKFFVNSLQIGHLDPIYLLMKNDEPDNLAPYSASVIDVAIDLNNQDKLETSILSGMILSGKFDITADHHRDTKNSDIKFTLAARKVNP